MPFGSAVPSFLPSFLPRVVDYYFKLIYLCWRQLFTGSNGCDKGRKRSAESFLYKPLRFDGKELFSCHENWNKPVFVLEKPLFAQFPQYCIGGRFLPVQLALTDIYQFTWRQRCVMPHQFCKLKLLFAQFHVQHMFSPTDLPLIKLYGQSSSGKTFCQELFRFLGSMFQHRAQQARSKWDLASSFLALKSWGGFMLKSRKAFISGVLAKSLFLSDSFEMDFPQNSLLQKWKKVVIMSAASD